MNIAEGLNLYVHNSSLNVLALKLGLWALVFVVVGILILRLTPSVLHKILLPLLVLGAIYLFSLWIS